MDLLYVLDHSDIARRSQPHVKYEDISKHNIAHRLCRLPADIRSLGGRSFDRRA